MSATKVYAKAFMSHAHADNHLCDPYYAALTRRGVSCYYDRQNPQVGRSLSQALQQEIEQVQVLIVMVSPAALESFWVNEEIDMFYSLMAKDRSRRLIPVKVAPCELPPRLAARWWIDATVQPLEQVINELVQPLRLLSESDDLRAKQQPSTAPALPPISGMEPSTAVSKPASTMVDPTELSPAPHDLPKSVAPKASSDGKPAGSQQLPRHKEMAGEQVAPQRGLWRRPGWPIIASIAALLVVALIGALLATHGPSLAHASTGTPTATSPGTASKSPCTTIALDVSEQQSHIPRSHQCGDGLRHRWLGGR